MKELNPKGPEDAFIVVTKDSGTWIAVLDEADGGWTAHNIKTGEHASDMAHPRDWIYGFTPVKMYSATKAIELFLEVCDEL